MVLIRFVKGRIFLSVNVFYVIIIFEWHILVVNEFCSCIGTFDPIIGFDKTFMMQVYIIGGDGTQKGAAVIYEVM